MIFKKWVGPKQWTSDVLVWTWGTGHSKTSNLTPFVRGTTRCHCANGSQLAETMHLPLNSWNLQTKALHACNMPVTVAKLQDMTSQKPSIFINSASGTSSPVGKFWTRLAEQLAPQVHRTSNSFGVLPFHIYARYKNVNTNYYAI